MSSSSSSEPSASSVIHAAPKQTSLERNGCKSVIFTMWNPQQTSIVHTEKRHRVKNPIFQVIMGEKVVSTDGDIDKNGWESKFLPYGNETTLLLLAKSRKGNELGRYTFDLKAIRNCHSYFEGKVELSKNSLVVGTAEIRLNFSRKVVKKAVNRRGLFRFCTGDNTVDLKQDILKSPYTGAFSSCMHNEELVLDSRADLTLPQVHPMIPDKPKSRGSVSVSSVSHSSVSWSSPPAPKTSISVSSSSTESDAYVAPPPPPPVVITSSSSSTSSVEAPPPKKSSSSSSSSDAFVRPAPTAVKANKRLSRSCSSKSNKSRASGCSRRSIKKQAVRKEKPEETVPKAPKAKRTRRSSSCSSKRGGLGAKLRSMKKKSHSSSSSSSTSSKTTVPAPSKRISRSRSVCSKKSGQSSSKCSRRR